MSTITTQQINDFILSKSKTHSAGYCNRMIVIMRYCYNLAIKWKTPSITYNPAKEVLLLPDPFGKKERYLNEEETKRLIKQVEISDCKMLKYIIPFLLLTGARKREALDAKWSDFNLETKTWTIPKCKLQRPRYVPIGYGMIELLNTIPKTCDYVFANPKTLKPYVGIFSSWNTARTKANLKDVRIHDLRHSFASFLVNNGVSIYEVQKILGHTQIKTTQRYAHLSNESLINAADVASNVINKALGVA